MYLFLIHLSTCETVTRGSRESCIVRRIKRQQSFNLRLACCNSARSVFVFRSSHTKSVSIILLLFVVKCTNYRRLRRNAIRLLKKVIVTMNEFNIRQRCADSVHTVETVLDAVKRIQVHEINQGRRQFSEYHHLFPLLKKYDDKFETYLRMKLSTFEYILSKVYNSLTKNWCNLHKQPI